MMRYYEKFCCDGCLYMVLDGGDESTICDVVKLCNRQRSVIPESQVLRWFTQICLGLKSLHERSYPIVHRDLKAQNILLVKKDGQGLGCAKIYLEFGTMKVLPAADALLQGGNAGRAHYCPSPEIASRMPYGAPADVWSLGVILYEMCTAYMPWAPEDISDHIENILIAPYSYVSEKYSSDLANMAAALLTHEPSDRPPAAMILQTQVLQSEIRGMLDNRQETKAQQVQQARRAPSAGPPAASPRPNTPKPSPRPASGRPVERPIEACIVDGILHKRDGSVPRPMTPRQSLRPLGEHNPRMPLTARSASPHEAAKLLLMQNPPSARPEGRPASRAASPHQDIAAKMLLDPSRAPDPAAAPPRRTLR